MEDSEITQIRETVRTELDNLQGKIINLQSVTQPIAPDNAIGRITRMDAINNKAVNDSALAKCLERQNQLQKVLSDINEPQFGICQRCQNPIPVQRLMHIPETRVCVNCG